MPDPSLILASASPRRAELLQQIGVQFSIRPTDIDEALLPGEAPEAYVLRLAVEKARAVGQSESLVLGSDTAVVAATGEVLGKPKDEADGLRMLKLLAGCEHQVLTSVAIVKGNDEWLELSASRVRFRAVSEPEMRAYWRSGEPLGKAGGYAIQGLGAVFVDNLQGSYSAVMGLPLAETARLLKAAGVDVLAAY